MKKKLAIFGLCMLASPLAMAKSYKVTNEFADATMYMSCQNSDELSISIQKMTLETIDERGETYQFDYSAKMRGTDAYVGSLKVAEISQQDLEHVLSFKDECMANPRRQLTNIATVEAILAKKITVNVSEHRDNYCSYNGSTIYRSFLNFTGERQVNELQSLYVNNAMADIESEDLGKRTCVSIRTVVDGVTGTVVAPIAATWQGVKFVLKGVINSILD